MIKLMGRLKEIYDEDGDHPYPMGTEGEVLYYSAHDGDCSLFLEDTNLIVAPVDDVEFFFPKETPMPEPATLSEQWSKEVPTEIGWYWITYLSPFETERGYKFGLCACYFNGDWWHYGGISIDIRPGMYFLPLSPPVLPENGTSYPPASPQPTLMPPPSLFQGKHQYHQWRILWHEAGEPATWRSSTLILEEAGSKEDAIEEFRTNRKPEGIIDVITPLKEKK